MGVHRTTNLCLDGDVVGEDGSVGVHRTTNLCSDRDVSQDGSVGVHRTTNLYSDGDVVGQDGSVGVHRTTDLSSDGDVVGQDRSVGVQPVHHQVPHPHLVRTCKATRHVKSTYKLYYGSYVNSINWYLCKRPVKPVNHTCWWL